MVSPKSTVAVEWIFCSIALIFLTLRIWVRSKVSKIGVKAEDFFLVIAQCMFFIWVSLDTYTVSTGFMDGNASYYDDEIFSHVKGDDELKIRVLKVVYSSSIPYYLCMWFIKFGILGFYYRLVPKNTQHRKVLHFVTATLLVTLIVIIFINIFLCQPINKNWSLNSSDKCYSSTSIAPFIFSAMSNIITDVMVFAIPFPLIPTLKTIPKRQRIGLIVTFSLGAVTITVFIVRIIIIAISATIAISAILTGVECGTAMIVACLPAFRVLLKKRVNKALKKLGKRSVYFQEVEIERGNLSPVQNMDGIMDDFIDTGYTRNSNIMSDEKVNQISRLNNQRDSNFAIGINDPQYDEILHFDDSLYSAPVMEFPYKNPTLSQVSIKRHIDRPNLNSSAIPYDPRQRFQKEQGFKITNFQMTNTNYAHTQLIYNSKAEPVEFDDEIDDSDSNLDNEEVDFSLNQHINNEQNFENSSSRLNNSPLTNSGQRQFINQSQQNVNSNPNQYTGILVVRTSFDSQRSTETD